MDTTKAPMRYPIGIQTFRDVREGGYAYVDKTRYLYELRHGSGKSYFLSRPRRFGKSLLLSTMQAYFEGRRELFEGLAANELEDDWDPRPVIRLDLSTVKATNVQELRELLDVVLWRCEQTFGREAGLVTPGSRLLGLIHRASAQAARQAVVLVDEYDAPLLNAVHDEETLGAFRTVMREFYAPLKACDEDLEFVFITGITKFSQLSIFSELNNLRNISMDQRYAAVCGITEEELTGELAVGVDQFAGAVGVDVPAAVALLKKHYDGYHFCDRSPDVYNPFSLLSALDEGAVRPYWFDSGTPTFLLELLKRHDWDIAGLEGKVARASSFNLLTERLDTPLPMLYQGGYLTIKGYDAVRDAYTLGIPNEEVSRGLSECLVQHTAPGALMEHYTFLDGLADCVRAGDVEGMLQRIRSYLASIPYHLGSHDERGFETTFFLIFDLLGIQIQTEFKTATGRVDAVIETPQLVCVLEFKYDGSARRALAQIDEKGYLVPFETDGRRLVKVGVNYSGVQRTIDEWLIEEG